MSASAGSNVALPTRGNTVFSALIGIASVLVLLQAVWAGIFIREGKDNNSTWVEVHARGADAAILFAIAAAIVVLMKIRHRKDLLTGSIAFAVALILEAFLGGLIGSSPGVEIIHFPLAMALMALSVWLPLRARQM